MKLMWWNGVWQIHETIMKGFSFHLLCNWQKYDSERIYKPKDQRLYLEITNHHLILRNKLNECSERAWELNSKKIQDSVVGAVKKLISMKEPIWCIWHSGISYQRRTKSITDNMSTYQEQYSNGVPAVSGTLTVKLQALVLMSLFEWAMPHFPFLMTLAFDWR